MSWAPLPKAQCPECGRMLRIKSDNHYPGHADHAAASSTPNRRRGRDCAGSRLPVPDDRWKVR